MSSLFAGVLGSRRPRFVLLFFQEFQAHSYCLALGFLRADPQLRSTIEIFGYLSGLCFRELHVRTGTFLLKALSWLLGKQKKNHPCCHDWPHAWLR